MPPSEFMPIYARIEQHLRDEIAAGRLGAGDRIPSEPELARDFATTRSTVAKALQQLVFEGVIIRRAGSGSYVAPRSLSAPIELSRVRSFEEQLAAKGAAIGYVLIGISEREPTDTEMETLHLNAGDLVHALDRLRLVGGKKVSVERRVFSAELGRLVTVDMLQSMSIHRILDERFRLAVHRVEGRIRAGLAYGEIARYLDIKPGSPLLIRDYVLFSIDRRPLVCGESFYLEEFQIDYVVQQTNGD
ncbi:GntR family transcriptional regulator [Neorhizobium sp. NCHU2750]|uniref:GntR family transcriptional regulator n=1 Tax=Neorhizobium sp. NCHU2750 TaxID=1825976 RepID=UPI000E757FAC|nr:GntR family transcriptional regulator [Neorhizobium sp. NCHU2750]